MRRGLIRLLIGVLVAGLAPTGGTALASVRGPDVSSFQHPHGYNIAWSTAHASGAAFAFVKATEGATYTNAYFRRDFAALAAAHMVRGAYHFADPAPGAANAVAQARHFVAVTGSLHQIGDLPGVLDLEVNGGLAPAALVAWTRAFLVEVRRLTGRTPMLYTYPSFWQHQMGNPDVFAGYPLWMATYSTRPQLFGGWHSYTFWQYTDHATLPGLPGPVDMSVFNGTYDQLWAHANLVGASALFSHYHQVVLRRGSTGVAVMALQAALGLTVDGEFGPQTATAVSNYQRRHALRATGVVSVPVWAALSGVPLPKPAPHTSRPSPVPAPHTVTAAGFAGDGRTDVLAVAKDGNLYLFRGAGNGRLAGPGQIIGRGWGLFTHVLSVGDLTGDGHPDLAGITRGGDLVLYPGNGHGGFLGTRRTIGHGWNGFSAVFSPGDFTGDGHPDLLAVTARGDLRLYRGDGHGGFLNGSRLLGHGWGTFARVFAVPGFGGPGRVDLAGVTRAGEFSLYRGDGAGGFSGTPRRVGTGWNAFTALAGSGTFAGRGTTGVLARTAAGGLWLYPGTGSGGWRARTPLGTGWNAFSTIVTG